VLLLDEIFAELDSRRVMGLIDAFGDFSQLFLTTAAEPPEKLKARARSFRIHDGDIEDIA
jgi:recombinational DNA repair ATPase RecF